MHFNLLNDFHAVYAVHHVDSKASSAKASCAADPVQVGLVVGVPFQIHREVKIHHKGHLLHINTCKQIEICVRDIINTLSIIKF